MTHLWKEETKLEKKIAKKIADNDAGYVRLPNGDLYYIAIMIKDSPLSDDENSKIISDISKIVYQYFCINKN